MAAPSVMSRSLHGATPVSCKDFCCTGCPCRLHSVWGHRHDDATTHPERVKTPLWSIRLECSSYKFVCFTHSWDILISTSTFAEFKNLFLHHWPELASFDCDMKSVETCCCPVPLLFPISLLIFSTILNNCHQLVCVLTLIMKYSLLSW